MSPLPSGTALASRSLEIERGTKIRNKCTREYASRERMKFPHRVKRTLPPPPPPEEDRN